MKACARKKIIYQYMKNISILSVLLYIFMPENLTVFKEKPFCWTRRVPFCQFNIWHKEVCFGELHPDLYRTVHLFPFVELQINLPSEFALGFQADSCFPSAVITYGNSGTIVRFFLWNSTNPAVALPLHLLLPHNLWKARKACFVCSSY